MKLVPTLLLDVMEHDRFICQIPYYGQGFPKLIDGQVKKVFDSRDIQNWVFEKRPSLKNRDIRIEFASQRVI